MKLTVTNNLAYFIPQPINKKFNIIGNTWQCHKTFFSITPHKQKQTSLYKKSLVPNRGQNKLECLFMAIYFLANPIFTHKTRAYLGILWLETHWVCCLNRK